jgi:hypothetical protein
MDPGPATVLAHRERGRLRLICSPGKDADSDIDVAFSLGETIPQSIEYPPTLAVKAAQCLANRELPQALAFATRSLELAVILEHVVEARILLANLDLTCGNVAVSRRHAEEAIHEAERLRSPRLQALAHLATAQALVATGANVAARASFEEAQRLANSPYDRATVLRAFSDYLMHCRLVNEASTMLAESDSLLAGIWGPNNGVDAPLQTGQAAQHALAL